MNSKTIGNKGENLALEFLLNKGYNYIERNFSTRTGEVDLILQDNEYLVFVEVKLRKNTKFGYPRDFVTLNKQNKIISTAESFIQINNLYDFQPRFDIVEIIEDENIIEHIINAFP
ncbi:YraN family protein [Miniphocaeibacter halophilus]|uniref:YraN family protein n=1 Tax=Miniphocaeibacter halophilus TaxID=2931922 RepID=A0AC61MP79_9FIRM|nr:YraN family protein [Miniphocaeibacter halophilus]QQK07314.1 YraN family protein [Miniphocaeibacter halophilus]